MPIIASLLRRAQANAAGVYIDRPWETLADTDRSPLEQGWYAWKEAHVAFEDGDLRSASGWLRAAEERLGTHDDPLCRVEVETTWMRLADRVDERAVVDRLGVLGLDLDEPRVVVVGESTAGAEPLDDER